MTKSREDNFVTYSMGEPQVHKEKQEHVWSLIDNNNFFRSQSAYFAENSISSCVKGTFRLIYTALECP